MQPGLSIDSGMVIVISVHLCRRRSAPKAQLPQPHHPTIARWCRNGAGAFALGFEVGTLQQWRTKGGGPPYYKLTRGNKQGAVRYNIPECIAWMQQFRRLHTSE